MNAPYGITITGNVATITLTVPALWWVAVTMLAGLFLTFSTVREWVAGVFDRVREEDKQAKWLFRPRSELTNAGVVTDTSTLPRVVREGMKIWE